MKKLFRKAMTVLGSVALVGATIGGAAAAAYPAPFNVGSYAVVYGASSQDATAASTVAGDLPAVAGTAGTVVGGDSYKLEKTSTKFHLGDAVTTLASALDEDELPSLLSEGKYIDDDNDEFDYTQKIELNGSVLSMWEDNDYMEDTPTVGIRIPSGNNVLNYTLDFSDEPLIGDMVTTSLPIMGKSYYVLSNTSSGANLILTLLDSATSATLLEGDTSTLVVEQKTYVVSIDFVSSTEVSLVVNGESTNTLAEAETYKLSDGSYVGIKDIRYNTKEGTLSSVEFSIGSGKLKLTSGSEVQINDVAISGLSTFITNDTKIQEIKIQWNADDDLFITEGVEITMPGFGAVKMSYAGIEYPTEETIEVAQGSDTYIVLNNFPLKDGPADIALLYGAAGGKFSGIGQAADKKLITTNASQITFDKDTDEYFVASYAATTEGESY